VAAGEKEIVQTIKAFGGAALNYIDILESDFAAAAGAAYTPPELGTFRRVGGSRIIQFLKNIPGVIETFQTSAATIRLPSGLVATNDALDGRQIWIKNSGTGNVTVEDHLGNNLDDIEDGVLAFAAHKDNDNWEVKFVYDVPPSASPGFTWGMSGNVKNQWLLNDTVPSNRTGRNFPFYNGEIIKVSVSNELSNTFDVKIYEHDGTTYTLLTTVSMVAQRSSVFILSGIFVTRNKELAVYISASGANAAKNPVVALILSGTNKP